jgi:general secretion pathway protein K
MVAARNHGFGAGRVSEQGVAGSFGAARVSQRYMGRHTGDTSQGLAGAGRVTPGALRRGSALLAVLWLSAGLAAIAFSLSTTVRGETERASTSFDSLRAYYLASGAVQRASLEMLWRDAGPGFVRWGATTATLEFPSGVADVEIIPEASKLNINQAPPEDLFRLLVALGQDPGRAREIVMAIEDWRSPPRPGVLSPFDEYYFSLGPSFRARHASLEETEELLLVRGVTPELYYGTYVPAPEGNGEAPRLAQRAGLADCVSVFGSRLAVDINTARPETLLAIGVPPDMVNAILERRRVTPFTPDLLAGMAPAFGPVSGRLRVGGNSIATVRATARLRLPGGGLSDLKRTVSALVKYMPPGYDSPIHFLRWYDTAWSN